MNENRIEPHLPLDDLHSAPVNDPATGSVAFHAGAAAPGRADPTDRIVEAIDARTWFRLISPRQRTLLRDLARGLTYRAIGERRQMHRTHVREEVEYLGRDLHVWLYEM